MGLPHFPLLFEKILLILGWENCIVCVGNQRKTERYFISCCKRVAKHLDGVGASLIVVCMAIFRYLGRNSQKNNKKEFTMSAKKILMLIGDCMEDYEVMVPFQAPQVVGYGGVLPFLGGQSI